MNKLILAFGFALLVAGCGNTAVDNELVGQAIRIMAGNQEQIRRAKSY